MDLKGDGDGVQSVPITTATSATPDTCPHAISDTTRRTGGEWRRAQLNEQGSYLRGGVSVGHWTDLSDPVLDAGLTAAWAQAPRCQHTRADQGPPSFLIDSLEGDRKHLYEIGRDSPSCQRTLNLDDNAQSSALSLSLSLIGTGTGPSSSSGCWESEVVLASSRERLSCRSDHGITKTRMIRATKTVPRLPPHKNTLLVLSLCVSLGGEDLERPLHNSPREIGGPPEGRTAL